jgi:hypothetical protein
MFETPESSASYLAAFHFMVLRGAAGVLIGVFYGLLVFVLVYPLTHIGLDYEHPGPLIPDTVGWANLATFIAGLIAGAAGALVRPHRGFSRTAKAKCGNYRIHRGTGCPRSDNCAL